MRRIALSFLAAAAAAVSFNPAMAGNNTAKAVYDRMAQLKGEWILSSADKQESKATKHKIVAPLIGTDKVAMSFRLIGKGTTVQETLLPGTKKEMVTMYHCGDAACSKIKATHYCVKKNQPELVANLGATTSLKLVFGCDGTTELCGSNQDHVHTITHEVSEGGSHLKTTFSSFKNGKHVKDSVYHFDRKI